MQIQNTIKAFHAVLRDFTFQSRKDMSFSEDFAVKRYLKKFQEPDPLVTNTLKQAAWDDWIKGDAAIPQFKYPSGFPELWKARLQQPRPCRFDTLSLPTGSEMVGTRGFNSIEQRLRRSVWTCTTDVFDRFSMTVYTNKALKRAFRKRYNNWYQDQNFDLSCQQSDKYMYKAYTEQFPLLSKKEISLKIFKWKLSRICTFTQGGRFSSVPKNNSTRRPIIIENLGNMIVQKQIGDHLRQELLRVFDVDLNVLQDKHRKMISCSEYATIDLKNASDRFHLSLIEWFLSPRLFAQLSMARSSFVYGPDGSYHTIEKISSMGNGFTFELMTWILTSVVRQLDPTGSVYGDDIIIRREYAPRLIELLERMGLVVNKEKSFITGPFRESCGGNFHDMEGYVESYDFTWPESIHDCVVFYNKTFRLSVKYPSFEELRSLLRRHIPKALHGPIEDDFFLKEIRNNWDDDLPHATLSGYFRIGGNFDVPPDLKATRRRIAKALCYRSSEIIFFKGFSYVEELASPRWIDLRKSNWAKYEMYLHSGRVCKDILTGRGRWVLCTYVNIKGSTAKYHSSLHTS